MLYRECPCALIKHGAAFYRMHPNHSMKVKNSKKEMKIWELQGIKNTKIHLVKQLELWFRKMLKRQESPEESSRTETLMTNMADLKVNTEKPGRNKIIEYKMDISEWRKGKIMSTLPKVTWSNIFIG